MNQHHETPPVGAPVEEAEASNTEIMQAVERAQGVAESSPESGAAAQSGSPSETVTTQTTADSMDAAEQLRREEISAVETELNMNVPATLGVAVQPESGEAAAAFSAMPSASAAPGAPSALGDPELTTPVRDGEIRISSDHPMAALYAQTPLPPDVRGNRFAGVLISLLAGVAFALVYAAVTAATLLPLVPADQLTDQLVQHVTQPSFYAAVTAFTLSMILLVLLVGRAGWWAYVLGGVLVGVVVWCATVAAMAVDAGGVNALLNLSPITLIQQYALKVPALAAAVVAREVTVWFGAWIGARGRRMKAKNAQALMEYEAALEDSQQPVSATQAVSAAR